MSSICLAGVGLSLVSGGISIELTAQPFVVRHICLNVSR